MVMDTTADGLLLVRFSRKLTPAETIARELELEEAFGVSEFEELRHLGQAGADGAAADDARLTLDAIRRSANPGAEQLIYLALHGSKVDGARFNPPDLFGALYLAFDIPTALAEIKYRWQQYNKKHKISQPSPTTYIGLYVTVDRNQKYCDLRNSNQLPLPDYLSTDEGTAYVAGQQLATEKREEGYHGIVYPSARLPDGDCMALFSPSKIVQFRQGPRAMVWQDNKGRVEARTISPDDSDSPIGAELPHPDDSDKRN